MSALLWILLAVIVCVLFCPVQLTFGAVVFAIVFAAAAMILLVLVGMVFTALAIITSMGKSFMTAVRRANDTAPAAAVKSAEQAPAQLSKKQRKQVRH